MILWISMMVLWAVLMPFGVSAAYRNGARDGWSAARNPTDPLEVYQRIRRQMIRDGLL